MKRIRAKFDALAQSRFGRDVVWNGISLVVCGVCGIAINAAIVAQSGTAALGVFNQVFAFYIVASMITVWGVHFSTLKHCSHEPDNPLECARIASSGIVLVSVLATPPCVALFWGRHAIAGLLESPAVAPGLAFVIPGLFLFSLNKVVGAVINGVRHMRAFAVFQALRYVIALIAVLVIIRLGYPASRLPLSLTLAEAVLFVGMILYIQFRLFPLRFSLGPEARAWFRRHLDFGSRGFLSGVMINVNTRVDVLMLGYFRSDAEVGLYSFAAILAEGIAQISLVMRRNVDPLLGRHFATGALEQIQELARKVRRTVYPVMGAISLLAIAIYPGAFTLLVEGADYHASWIAFIILVSGVAINAGYRPFWGVLLQGGRPGYQTILTCALVAVNVALNAALIPLFGIPGAAAATALVLVLEGFFLVGFARRLLGVRL